MNELNATFTNFVNFANQAIQAGNKDAVARVAQPEGKFTLGTGRTVTASRRGDASFDKTFAWFRSDEAKSANESARAVFKMAIADIFGGEKNIPESVKKQMTNFGTDKPLSARRIKAIATAIEEFDVQHTANLKITTNQNLSTLRRLGLIDAAEQARVGAKLENLDPDRDRKEIKQLAETYQKAYDKAFNEAANLESYPDEHPELMDSNLKTLAPKFESLLKKSDLLSIKDNTPENRQKAVDFFKELAKIFLSLGEMRSSRAGIKALQELFLKDAKAHQWVSDNITFIAQVGEIVGLEVLNFGDTHKDFDDIYAKVSEERPVTKSEMAVYRQYLPVAFASQLTESIQLLGGNRPLAIVA